MENSEEHDKYLDDLDLVQDTTHKAFGGIDSVKDWERTLEACRRIVAYKRNKERKVT